MKTIGLLGGMSWESTIPYYQVINETVRAELGGLHSAKILMYSVEFDELESRMRAARWDECAAILADAAKRLEAAGADCIVICTNTMHKLAPEIQVQITVPLLHIAEVTAQRLKEADISKVGLLGTRYTMTQDFYKDVLIRAGIEVLIPEEEEEIERVNAIIFDELCVGITREESRQALLRAIENLRNRGVRGVILGCTELDMLVHPEDVKIHLFDTTILHAEAAARTALE